MVWLWHDFALRLRATPARRAFNENERQFRPRPAGTALLALNDAAWV
ncbi:hypothetical protein [Polaromonas jejuensis]|uniref:Uncharacterized protein n=1 Tax=Polaromonas jejuensis TaxID=457502 RepID=A0ABW0QGP1_9BURK|nr:hypothetical protein [Polaromonas jejuensis]